MADGVSSVALFYAVRAGDEARVAELLDAGISIESRHYATELTPLMDAVSSSDDKEGMARFLLGRGANVNAVNVNGNTALMRVVNITCCSCSSAPRRRGRHRNAGRRR